MTACSNCHQIAVRLLGGSCQACTTRCTCGGPPHALCCPAYEAHVRGLRGVARAILSAASTSATALGASIDEDHEREVNAAVAESMVGRASTKLRPLPGTSEAVAQLTGELRAEGVEVGVLRAECSTCGDHYLEGCPECGVDAESEALPASIEDAIRDVRIRFTDFGLAPCGSLDEDTAATAGRNAIGALRTAIRAELGATEQRVRESAKPPGDPRGFESRVPPSVEPAVAAREPSVAEDGTCYPWCLACYADESRAKLRAATKHALAEGCTAASFAKFMGAVAPGWTQTPPRAPSSGDVCGVRAAAWMGMASWDREVIDDDCWRTSRKPSPLCIPCPGCGAAAGEPCREATPQVDALLVEQRDAALADAATQRRILTMRESDAQVAGDRWREEIAHAEANTQDAERQRDAALAQLDAVRAELTAERERYLRDRGELHRALERAEAAERELAAMRPAPKPPIPPEWCQECAEQPCVCHEAGLP